MICSLDELVKDGVNGLVFENAEQLAKQLEVRVSSSIPSALLDGIDTHSDAPRGFPVFGHTRLLVRVSAAHHAHRIEPGHRQLPSPSRFVPEHGGRRLGMVFLDSKLEQGHATVATFRCPSKRTVNTKFSQYMGYNLFPWNRFDVYNIYIMMWR